MQDFKSPMKEVVEKHNLENHEEVRKLILGITLNESKSRILPPMSFLKESDKQTQIRLQKQLKGKKLNDFIIMKRIGKSIKVDSLKSFYGSSSAVYEVRLKSTSCGNYKSLSTYPLALKLCLNYFHNSVEKIKGDEFGQCFSNSLPEKGFNCSNVLNQLYMFVDTFKFSQFEKYDHGDFHKNKTCFFVYPLCHCNLEVFLHNDVKQLSIERFLVIAYEILNGICHLHKNKIVHCNIKDDNILIDHFGQVMISGFQMHIDGNSLKNFKDFILVNQNLQGSPYSSPPEIFVKSDEINYSKRDVFSLGLVLYKLFSKNDPFSGKDPKDRKQNHYVPLPNSIPPEVRSAIDSMLKIDIVSRSSCYQAKDLFSKLIETYKGSSNKIVLENKKLTKRINLEKKILCDFTKRTQTAFKNYDTEIKRLQKNLKMEKEKYFHLNSVFKTNYNEKIELEMKLDKLKKEEP